MIDLARGIPYKNSGRKSLHLLQPPNLNHDITMTEADQEQSIDTAKSKHKKRSRSSYLKNRDKVIERSLARYYADPEKRKQQSRERRAANRDKNTEWRRAWENANRDKLRAQSRAWYLLNREKKKEQDRARRLANPEKKKEQARAWRLANPDKARAISKAWYEANRDKQNKRRRDRRAENRESVNARLRVKRKSDMQFKIKSNLRTRLFLALKRQNTKKKSGMTALLGCTIQELKCILELRFTKGMQWDNYGSFWHVDHIIPLSSFDLSDPKQLAIACHYTNLRPMKASANMAKGAKITEPQMSLLLPAA